MDASGTVALREGSVSVGAGVSIGEHLEAGGSASATFTHGKATVAVSGDVAALIGVEADVSVTVDTKQIAHDATAAANAVADVGKKAENAVVDTGKKAENAVVDTGKKAENAVVDTGKKAGNAIVNTGKKQVMRLRRRFISRREG